MLNVHARQTRLIFIMALVLLASAEAPRAAAPDDCSYEFGKNHGRRAAKVRDPLLACAYEKLGTLDCPKDVKWWFEANDEWMKSVKVKKPGPNAMPGIETRVVTLQAYLLAAKFEGGVGGDGDLHVQLSANDKWETSPHLIAEVPPGEQFCTVRHAMWDLVKKDAAPASPGNTHFFRRPPLVRVTGFVFIDLNPPYHTVAHHGPRQIRDGHRGMVANLWELHPVIAVAPAFEKPCASN
jgi:hypothetical protein